jgi:hypothetical protein
LINSQHRRHLPFPLYNKYSLIMTQFTLLYIIQWFFTFCFHETWFVPYVHMERGVFLAVNFHGSWFVLLARWNLWFVPVLEWWNSVASSVDLVCGCFFPMSKFLGISYMEP